MHGPGRRFAPGLKEKVDYKKSFKFLFNRLKPHFHLVIIAMIFSIVSATTAILIPDQLGGVTDKIITKIVTNGPATEIIKTLIFIAIILVVSQITSYLTGFIMSKVNRNVTYKLRKDINQKLNKLPLNYFDKTNNGEILSFSTNDIDTVSTTLTQNVTEIINSITTFIGIIIMMLRISGLLTATIAVIVPIFLILLLFTMNKSQKHFIKQQDYLGHINGHIEEMYAGHQVTSLYNNQESSINKLEELNETLFHSAWKSQFLSGLMHPLMMAFGNIGFILTCIVGGNLAIKGKISIGNIQAFISYARNFSNPLTQIASITGQMQQSFAAIGRIDKYLSEEDEIETGTLNLTDKKIKGEISFDNISFGYDKEKPVITNFTAKIKPGQKVAIVGPTGAGKTTIVKLLMRFYETDMGNILIDNINIKDIEKHEIRKNVGMVLQDTWLFEGTIKDNLTFGNPKASEKEIKDAVESASLTHIINTLPNNYDFMINEETSNISEGEKQLLTIARTFLLNPSILILDEATSSVDTRTEILIQKALAKLMRDKTTFIIAHRLSTIISADVILVMNEGNIVEVGNHEDLLKKKGFYEQLYNSQFEK